MLIRTWRVHNSLLWRSNAPALFEQPSGLAGYRRPQPANFASWPWTPSPSVIRAVSPRRCSDRRLRRCLCKEGRWKWGRFARAKTHVQNVVCLWLDIDICWRAGRLEELGRGADRGWRGGGSHTDLWRGCVCEVWLRFCGERRRSVGGWGGRRRVGQPMGRIDWLAGVVRGWACWMWRIHSRTLGTLAGRTLRGGGGNAVWYARVSQSTTLKCCGGGFEGVGE